MNKEIEVLYKIFELELAPPLMDGSDGVYNKHSDIVGVYNSDLNRLMFYDDICEAFLEKIKRTFNLDKLSNSDVYLITKHMLNWLQNNFTEKVSSVRVTNSDSDSWNGSWIFYPSTIYYLEHVENI